ncbi:unnamed protein product [Cladocopium goreaui]|uniref:Homeobox protein Wariai (Homeobox protein 1) (DdHbx-1) n=1 Tax=Cladocopium goreaui TaxID=2562237 RepID=A0A9P1BU92_9DINO|nr:unnamed protein product [Cladocopium goreaui]
MLHRAVATGNSQEVERALRVNPGACNHIDPASGEAPLHIAARLGQDGIVRRLLRCGASKDMPMHDHLNATPLHLAAAFGCQQVVEVLLEARADPTFVDSQGLVAARYAEARGHTHLAQLLDDARHKAGDFDLSDIGRMTARGISEVADSVRSAFEGIGSWRLGRTEVGFDGGSMNVFGESEQPAPAAAPAAAPFPAPEAAPDPAPVDPATQMLYKIQQQVMELEKQAAHDHLRGARAWDDELTKAAEALDDLSLAPGSEARQARKALIERIEWLGDDDGFWLSIFGEEKKGVKFDGESMNITAKC